MDCVELLIEAKSPIDRKNEDEQTPLHLATINGRIDVVKYLLKRDRNEIMNEDEDSNTPIHLACMNKRYKTLEVLLKYGADVHCRNTKKWTPLDCAGNQYLQSCINIMNQFLNHIQPASVGSIECAELLLQNSATIDPVDRSKTTPLHLAAENGHAKMIELLLDYGADITMEDINSRNALERAILSGRK